MSPSSDPSKAIAWYRPRVAKRPKAKPPRKRGKRARPLPILDDDCTIPRPVPSRALPSVVLETAPAHEAREVSEYVETQVRDERVVHAEMVASERVFQRKHDVWIVHTNKTRWWVVTNPTNLYRQKDFPSVDYLLSFHVGLIARTMSRQSQHAPASDEEQNRFAAAWRRWEQATETFDTAEEAEDFQAVGMRCRECLLELVRAASSPEMVPAGTEAPKKGDFVHWSELVADEYAKGPSGADVRSYLKHSAKSTWQYVNWLTHAANAVRSDAQLALDATGHVLSTLGANIVRAEQGAPERCPSCRSYQLSSTYQPERGTETGYVIICNRCGWSRPEEH